MIDRDLADLYQVSVKRLNEQVKRNLNRFPDIFRFQLTEKERNELVANSDRFETLKHSSVIPTHLPNKALQVYPAIEINEFINAHDRFIIIDNKTIYHFWASLKDLGKKWFAFSKMDVAAIEMLNKLEVNNLYSSE
jgi:hypothetical protein